jgi:hypothetical protein
MAVSQSPRKTPRDGETRVSDYARLEKTPR